MATLLAPILPHGSNMTVPVVPYYQRFRLISEQPIIESTTLGTTLLPLI